MDLDTPPTTTTTKNNAKDGTQDSCRDELEWLSLSLATGSKSAPPAPASTLQTIVTPVPVETSNSEPESSAAPTSYRDPSSETQMLSATAPASGQNLSGRLRPGRARRSTAQGNLQARKRNTITPPYLWATTRRAHIHSFEYLMARGIKRISGEVKCRQCEKKYEIEYDLEERFLNLANFIVTNKYDMHDRAPGVWKTPVPLDCNLCGYKKSVLPTTGKKRSINWLFLLLSQTIGCCKLSELRYFCKHTKTHRTGAKDRLLYLTYLGLCKQLDPSGPFDL